MQKQLVKSVAVSEAGMGIEKVIEKDLEQKLSSEALGICL